MATSAERNVNNYKVDTGSMDQFYNITNFVKNMTLIPSPIHDIVSAVGL